MRVLLIEDDALVAKAVKLTLADDGVVVHATSMGEEGVSLAKLYDYDAILLDLNLPDLCGQEVLKQLRTAKVTTPVMVLSGQIDTHTKVRALDAGADDYITKPFHNYELTARVRALVRRSKGYAASTIVIGDMVLNLDSKTVAISGARVPVSTKEYQILELLCLRKGATLNKEVFLNHLYGEIDEPDPKIIDVFVCKLRKKLAAAANGHQHIETIWGRGYLVRDQADRAAIAA
jgi:two-component system, cell cycle response regulator CtrA